MPEALIAAVARTPIGRAHKGALIEERPDDMLAFAIGAALERVPQLTSDRIDDVIVGCGYPEQEQGHNIARRAALLASLPVEVPGTTVARFCASSLQALRMAFHAIRAGEGDAFVVGGVESISRIDREPRSEHERHRMLQGPPGRYDVHMPMGITAENVAEIYGVSRAEMDRYAQRSQQQAAAASAAGFFDAEIVPYTTKGGKTLARDESIRPTSTLDALARLRPAFREGGSVTAGNSCPLNDGAAAAVVVSDRLAEELGLEPMARILSSAVSGVDPALMGVGPIEAIRAALARADLTIADVGVLELNEAFAAQVIPVCREVGIDPFDERVNPHGGAIALGHPFGMTGVRIMSTLLSGLAARDVRIGVETMCVAQGQGVAMVVERVA